MVPMIVALGIAAAWFEYSYRRSRGGFRKRVQAQTPAAQDSPPAPTPPQPASETEAHVPQQAASSHWSVLRLFSRRG